MKLSSARTTFHIAIHDVHAGSLSPVHAILDALAPLVGPRVSLAVTPHWRGRSLRRDGAEVRALARRVEEIHLHGWSHRRARGRGLVSLVTGGCDEFNGLSRDAATRRLRIARLVLEDTLGHAVTTVVPPAFQRGPVTRDVLASAGLRHLVGWRRIVSTDGTTRRLATSLWDVSPAAGLAPLGRLAGRLAGLDRGALPVLALHPADVARGHLVHAVRLARHFLDARRNPVLLTDTAGYVQ